MNSTTDQLEQMRLRYLTEAVKTATPTGRLVMILDNLEMTLGRAVATMAEAEQDTGPVKDLKAINDYLVRSQQILMALYDTLDESWEGAPRLKGLYFHLHGQLVQANVTKDKSLVLDASEHVSRLAAAWRKAAGAGQAAPTQPAAAAS